MGAQAIHWSCDGSPAFELTESTRTAVGTTVTLTLLDEEKRIPRRLSHSPARQDLL